MSASPQIGYGSVYTVNDGVASADQAFSFLYECELPSGEETKVDISSMNMASRSRRYIIGLREPGTFTFKVEYVEADYRRLIALQGVAKTWKGTPPDDSTGTPPVVSWSGTLTKFPVKLTLDGVTMIECEGFISGDITVT